MSSIINKYGSFVKEQIEHNVRSAQKYRGDEKRAHAYNTRAMVFQQMLTDLENFEIPPVRQTLSPNQDSLYRLTPSEIEDLPDELLEQLSLTDTDKKEFLIVDIIETLGGATTIDKLLIAWYRRTGEVEKRTKLNSRLYRMANKEMIFAHPARKGVYGLRPFPPEEGTADLFDEETIQDLV